MRTRAKKKNQGPPARSAREWGRAHMGEQPAAEWAYRAAALTAALLLLASMGAL